MHQTLTLYLRQIESAHQLGNDTEHTHRPALKGLLDALNDQVTVTNEPKRIQLRRSRSRPVQKIRSAKRLDCHSCPMAAAI